MKKVMLMAFVMISIFSASCFADEMDPGQILKEVSETYKFMATYKSEGTRTINTEQNNQKSEMETSYSILLKKPNLYRISHETTFSLSPTNNVISGTVWSDGTQPYEYERDAKSYSKIPTDLNAIGRAAGMSSPTIIFAFFPSMLEEPWDYFDQLTNEKLESIEKIGDEECYVISADLKVPPEEVGLGNSAETDLVTRKEKFWISKARNVILKHSAFFEGEYAMPDEQIIKMLEAMEQPVNEETIKELKEKMQTGPRDIKWLYADIQTQISSPELTTDDFQFSLPEGTVLEEPNISN